MTSHREVQPQRCDKEHATSASFQGLVREREELRSEVEVLRANIADLEAKLSQCAATCEAEAVKAADAALERAAKASEAHAEFIKHTTHRDGLGMGSQCCEFEATRIAREVRALKSGGGK